MAILTIPPLDLSATALIGPTAHHPHTSVVRIDSFSHYQTLFHSADDDLLAESVHGYFQNGGQRLFVASTGRIGEATQPQAYLEAANAALQASDLGGMAAPGLTRAHNGVQIYQQLIQTLSSHPGKLLVDPPEHCSLNELSQYCAQFDTQDAALYYPWLILKNGKSAPASGHIAGILSRNIIEHDSARPLVNQAISGVRTASKRLTESDVAHLGQSCVNLLRPFPGRGVLIWGGRTLAQHESQRYFAIQRYLDYLQYSLIRGLHDLPKAPCDALQCQQISQAVSAFLTQEWQAQHFAGNSPTQSFSVHSSHEPDLACEITLTLRREPRPYQLRLTWPQVSRWQIKETP